jgi:hypothetical protein
MAERPRVTDSNNVHPLALKEVWGIVIDNGTLLPPIDDDNCDSFIAYPTEGDARLGLQSQIDKGYIESGTVRRLG